MPQGKLQVVLVSAKGLENTDFLYQERNMDPYVLLTCRTQEQKSSVASGKGSEPEWNEDFIFNIFEGASELALKIMDSDTGSQDDFVGEVAIPLEPVFIERNIPLTAYTVVKDGEYRGEIKLGLTFTPEERESRDFEVEESFGGWKQSSYTD
ncbi:elicitor-responsive protein 3-like [Gossypium australe]|uniref:Elicitor-responsive protein 3-like n=1 Tax=Gossypium australe TaxID=47621 RepID=A0A5B6W4J1_9ROSI|nr:elicitor-responsive protein 3-like [Gossypium australe]